MRRVLTLLLLAGGSALAQDKEDDDEIIVGSEEPAPPVALVAKPKREPDHTPARVRVRKGVYSFEFPDDWVLAELDPVKPVAAWRVRLPGTEYDASIVVHREPKMGDPRSRAFAWKKWLLETAKATTFSFRPRPLPHAVLGTEVDGHAAVAVFVFLRIKGNAFHLDMRCRKVDAAEAIPDLLHAAQSLDAPLELWPAIPTGYATQRKGRYLYAVHPDVKASLKTVEAVLRAAETRFKRVHGALPRSEDPVVVLVHDSKLVAGRVSKEAGEATGDSHLDRTHDRLFIVPVSERRSGAAAWLAGEAHGLFFRLKYGGDYPLWLWAGEKQIGRAAEATGKALPYMKEGFAVWIDDNNVYALDRVEAMVKAREEGWPVQGFFYASMLHAGKYKGVYRNFLKDFAATYDAESAVARHFKSIDQEKLRVTVSNFMNRSVKRVKRKK